MMGRCYRRDCRVPALASTADRTLQIWSGLRPNGEQSGRASAAWTFPIDPDASPATRLVEITR